MCVLYRAEAGGGKAERELCRLELLDDRERDDPGRLKDTVHDTVNDTVNSCQQLSRTPHFLPVRLKRRPKCASKHVCGGSWQSRRRLQLPPRRGGRPRTSARTGAQTVQAPGAWPAHGGMVAWWQPPTHPDEHRQSSRERRCSESRRGTEYGGVGVLTETTARSSSSGAVESGWARATWQLGRLPPGCATARRITSRPPAPSLSSST